MLNKEELFPEDIIVSSRWGECRIATFEEAQTAWSKRYGHSMDMLTDCGDSQVWAYALNPTAYIPLEGDIPYKFQLREFKVHKTRTKDYDPKQQPYTEDDI